MRNFFSEHPKTVGESYWQHLLVALGFAFALFGAAIAALIHAFFPAWFEKTASQKITLLHDRMVCKRQSLSVNSSRLFDGKIAGTARQI